MPKLKVGTILPTPAEDAVVRAAATADPDAVPITDAEWTEVKSVTRRGRPLGSGRKTPVTLRLDSEVMETFRASGDGWQTRINEALKSWEHTQAEGAAVCHCFSAGCTGSGELHLRKRPTDWLHEHDEYAPETTKPSRNRAKSLIHLVGRE
jgi:uncharacterized protein (DUF4415 family)